eukprot:8911395-Alexandrium_andersonii.AAC.1
MVWQLPKGVWRYRAWPECRETALDTAGRGSGSASRRRQAAFGQLRARLTGIDRSSAGRSRLHLSRGWLQRGEGCCLSATA